MLQTIALSKFWYRNSVDGRLPSLQKLQVETYLSTTRQVVGSREAALETLKVLRQVVSKARFSNLDQLITLIRCVGRRLVEAQPKGHLNCTLYYMKLTLNAV